MTKWRKNIIGNGCWSKLKTLNIIKDMKEYKIKADKESLNKKNIKAEQESNHIDNSNKQADCADNQVDGKQYKKTSEDNKKESTEDKIEALGNKLNECNDKYLRLYSEFDNYRKRTNKEKFEIIKNASEELIKNLLPVLDDYERALLAMEKIEDEQLKKTIEGMHLVYKKFYSVLEQKGLKPIEAKGKDFDENIHEAVAQLPASKEEEKGKVMDEVTKGYYLNDKVIRYSKVVVAI